MPVEPNWNGERKTGGVNENVHGSSMRKATGGPWTMNDRTVSSEIERTPSIPKQHQKGAASHQHAVKLARQHLPGGRLRSSRCEVTGKYKIVTVVPNCQSMSRVRFDHFAFVTPSAKLICFGPIVRRDLKTSQTSAGRKMALQQRQQEAINPGRSP